MYYYLGGLDVAVGVLHGFGLALAAALGLEGDVLVVGLHQMSLGGLALEGRHRKVAAHILLVLAFEFERRVKPCRRHIELKVLGVAVQAALYGAAQLYAVVDSDAVVAVDGYIDAVVGRDFQVDQELVAAGQCLCDNVHYVHFVYHNTVLLLVGLQKYCQ